MTAPFIPPPNPNAIRSTEQHNLGQPGFQGGFAQPGVENTYGDMRDILSQSGGGMGMLDWIPVLSQLRGFFQAQQMGQQGHPLMAALLGGMSMIPGGGAKKGVAKAVGTKIEKTLGPRTAEEFAKEYSKAQKAIDKIEDEFVRLHGGKELVDFTPFAPATASESPIQAALRAAYGHREAIGIAEKEHAMQRALGGLSQQSLGGPIKGKDIQEILGVVQDNGAFYEREGNMGDAVAKRGAPVHLTVRDMLIKALDIGKRSGAFGESERVVAIDALGGFDKMPPAAQPFIDQVAHIAQDLFPSQGKLSPSAPPHATGKVGRT